MAFVNVPPHWPPSGWVVLPLGDSQKYVEFARQNLGMLLSLVVETRGIVQHPVIHRTPGTHLCPPSFWAYLWLMASPRERCQGVLTKCHVLFVLTTDDVRLFAFVRFTTGDAMSKRSKFALITWIGEDVSGLQRAKTGTDKTLVKEVVQVMCPAMCQKDHHPVGG